MRPSAVPGPRSPRRGNAGSIWASSARRVPTSVLPALSDDPYLEIPPSLEAVSSRMRFLYDIRSGKPSLVLTNPFGLLKPLPSPEDLERSFLKLEVGEKADRDDLLRTFAEYGYSREDIIASPGEYAWRGGIVDVFPPWQDAPVRIEFAADTVASLREFDTGTQRSLRRLDRALVPSLREFPGTPEFLEDWVRRARKAGGEARADLEEKIRFLEGGRIPPLVRLSVPPRRGPVRPVHPVPRGLRLRPRRPGRDREGVGKDDGRARGASRRAGRKAARSPFLPRRSILPPSGRPFPGTPSSSRNWARSPTGRRSPSPSSRSRSSTTGSPSSSNT